MILLQSPSKFVLQTLQNRVLNSSEKGIDLDCQSVEFDDVRYHIQFSMKTPQVMLLSVSLPTPPPETVFIEGLPVGSLEAVKAVYGGLIQILDPPKDGYNLTMKLNLSKLPSDEGPTSFFLKFHWELNYHHHDLQDQRQISLIKIASVRDVVLGAPLRLIFKQLAMRAITSELDQPVALVHRPMESFFLLPQPDKVIVVYPMRFKDSIDTILAISFLQEFVEARRTPGLNSAPICTWSPSPPHELKEAPAEALDANAGFVTFVIFPRHVEGRKLDRTAWSILTFHAYVSYHVKCSESFMHTRMRRRVESLIEALDRAKPDMETSKKMLQGKSFKRLSLKDARNNSNT